MVDPPVSCYHDRLDWGYLSEVRIVNNFKIIQGGMGVGVSNWTLANAVARRGQLGVVSGTGIAVLMARRLQDGDEGGHTRRALAAFPVQSVAQRIIDKYYLPNGREKNQPYLLTPMPGVNFSPLLLDLTITSNFVEVWLAKEGHHGKVGINFLEKIQTPHVPSIFGAMLAGVDYILMGAGIPRFIPGVIDAFAEGRLAELRIDTAQLDGTAAEPTVSRLDPNEFFGGVAPKLKRPDFLAIVASPTLGLTLARKSNGKVNGFIIEGPTAGGHNAPPRGQVTMNVRGEPIYGPRDVVDLSKFREIGLPFWLAGSYGTAEGLKYALSEGASGIQVGTAFAFCDESGIAPHIKADVIQKSLSGDIDVYTDAVASPTGFPFKVVQVGGTLSDETVYQARPRVCDAGYLRQVYRKEDGSLGYRCPAEPIDHYGKKGGDVDVTAGRKCICNALFGTIGLGQVDQDGNAEPAIVTAGDDVKFLERYIPKGQNHYTVDDVLRTLLEGVEDEADARLQPQEVNS